MSAVKLPVFTGGNMQRRSLRMFALSQYRIEQKGRQVLVVDKDTFSIGKSQNADLIIDGPNVRDEHAQLLMQGNRVKCIATMSKGSKFIDPTYTWLENTEMRKEVEYLVEPGNQIQIGTDDTNTIRVHYDQTTSNDNVVLEMMMKGMVRSTEVISELDKKIQS
eukprot:TRINITY_DN18876_c0_g1_i1.p2 TRINITY_DN18876_c0_g1~~TRINITY_DN18876_c0_g1_i1.p2  ORF type:complete len:163 (-),score=20.82 TRINITY_DN18876_c0_g1_i1:376-864(-)